MRGCVAPRVAFESESELRGACESLLAAYTALAVRVVGEKFNSRGAPAREWTELDRLMLGIASFDEILDGALPLVLQSTGGSGALYAHDLNRRVVHSVNKSNFIFFYETTSRSEAELLTCVAQLLERMLLTGARSHYEALFARNFRRFRAYDADEWLVCPAAKVREFEFAVTTVCEPLHDVVDEILQLLGLRAREKEPAGTRTR